MAAMTPHEKKLFIMWRLVEKDDRVIRQRRSECGTFPDAVWFLLPPQTGGGAFLGAVKWLEHKGLIIESIAPTISAEPRASGSNDDLRRYYQGGLGHQVYAASPAGRKWFEECFGL